MEIDIERVMILLQRRYGAVREFDRLTGELEEFVARNDEVSASMILDLRGDEMEKADQCMEELRQMGESSREIYEQLQALIASDLDTVVGESTEERKIYEIRRKTQDIIDRLRQRDQRLSERLAGEKSFYKTVRSAG